ncbi:MAG: type II secretion system F family protein [Verrucomicrobia bacterium]|nr:type II secretion system F family protein [Verrucomicrobiota bacterium]
MDARGRESTGTVRADSRARAITLIKEKGLFPTSVTEASGNGRGPSAAKASAGGGKGLRMELRIPGFTPRVKERQLSVLTRQLAICLDAGLPLLRALKTLLKQEKHPALRTALEGLGESIESGSNFSEALSQYPRIFNHLFVNMVRAGEAGGILDEILSRLAEFMEKAERIRNKVKGAMVYPVVVLIMATLILIFLMVFIIPRFEDIFNDLLSGKELPALTQAVMTFSEGMRDQWYFHLLAIAIMIVGAKLIRRTGKGASLIDAIKLKLPIFGVLFRKASVARFSRTLGTLLQSGVPILQALNIVRDTAGNQVISDCIMQIHDSVKEGDTIADPMAASGAFPDIVVSMVDVGEETGALPEMLLKIADAYDDEVDTTVEGLTSVIEPLMIVFLAVIVGVIVVSMFLPLIGIIENLTVG